MGTGSCTKSPAWEERRGHGREERGGGVTGRRSRGVTGGRSRGVTGGWSTVGGSRAGGTGGITGGWSGGSWAGGVGGVTGRRSAVGGSQAGAQGSRVGGARAGHGWQGHGGVTDPQRSACPPPHSHWSRRHQRLLRSQGATRGRSTALPVPQPILLATAAVSPKRRSEQVSPMHRPPVGWLPHPLGQGLRGYRPGAHCCPASPRPPQAGAFTGPWAFTYPLPPA